MTMQNDGFDASRRATSEDVRRMLGDLEDVTVAEILSSQPTIGEVADAAVWARGDGDLAAHEHKELSAGALSVAEILLRQEEEVVDERH